MRFWKAGGPKLIVGARYEGSINFQHFLPCAGEIFRRSAEMAELPASEKFHDKHRGAFVATDDLPADLQVVYS